MTIKTTFNYSPNFSLRKRSKKQGVGGKPTNVKTFAAKGGIIKTKPNMGLYGRS